ncbi:MAG: hypothetical protein ACFFCS_18910 [Candidatus Hodarchaeota archaeon]
MEQNNFLEIELENGDIHTFKVFGAVKWLEKIERIKRAGVDSTVIRVDKRSGYETGPPMGNIEEGMVSRFNKVCTYFGIKRLTGKLQLSASYLVFTSKKLDLYFPLMDAEAILGYKSDQLEIHMSNGDMYEFRVQFAKDWMWKIRELQAVNESMENNKGTLNL